MVQSDLRRLEKEEEWVVVPEMRVALWERVAERDHRRLEKEEWVVVPEQEQWTLV